MHLVKPQLGMWIAGTRLYQCCSKPVCIIFGGKSYETIPMCIPSRFCFLSTMAKQRERETERSCRYNVVGFLILTAALATKKKIFSALLALRSSVSALINERII